MVLINSCNLDYYSYNELNNFTPYTKETCMEDKTLICQDCGKEFIFTVGEQEFYKEKGFNNEPKRCKECRDKRKAQRRQPREEEAAPNA